MFKQQQGMQEQSKTHGVKVAPYTYQLPMHVSNMQMGSQYTHETSELSPVQCGMNHMCTGQIQV